MNVVIACSKLKRCRRDTMDRANEGNSMVRSGVSRRVAVPKFFTSCIAKRLYLCGE